MERFGVRYIKYRVQFPTANMEATKDLEVYTEFESKKNNLVHSGLSET